MSYLIPTQLKAQVANIDSLRALIQVNQTDLELASTLNLLAFELREIDQQEALDFAIRAERLAKSSGDTLQLAKAKGNIGWINYRKANWEQTFRYSREAYELSKSVGDNNETAMALNNLGALYYEQQDYLKAIEFFREAYQHVRDTDNYFTIIRSLNNTALNFVRAEMPDSAIVYATKAIQVNNAAGRPFSLSFPYRVIGDVYFLQNDFNGAIEWYEDALAIAISRNLSSFQASILHRLGQSYLLIGDLNVASNYLNEGEALASERNLRDELSRIYYFQARLNDELGNISEAYRYQTLHLNLLNELESSAIRNRLAIIQGMFEAERMEANLRVLEMENVLNRERAVLAEFYSRLALLGILVVFGMLALVYLMYQRKSAINDELILQQDLISEQNIELEQKAIALEEANNAKNILFSILAHDLRTPVAQIKTMLGLLHDEHLSREDFSRLSKLVRGDVAGLFITLDNILKWSKAQMEGFKVSPSNVRLNQVVDDAASLLREQIDNKNLNLQVYLTEKDRMLIDKDHADVIVRNLLSNAIKFSHDGGTIKLSAQHRNGEITMNVEDEGIGMNGDMVKSILHPDDTILASNDGTRSETGNGIGIKLCKKFVRMNGGSLDVESTPGAGTVFRVTMQAAK
ncbi:MAG: tetratricopeptide repeat protein [Balneolales bacterium]|nr:tetratricopeptide repeat protein [Balneolales bacterium]